MDADPGLMPTEHRIVQCPGGDPQVADIFGAVFVKMHTKEVEVVPAFLADWFVGNRLFALKGFAQGGGPEDTIFSKTYAEALPGSTEHTQIKLRHTPK